MAMATNPRSRLSTITEEQLERCADRLARRAGLETDLGGRDARDFIQDALGKLLAGERSWQPRLSLEDNLFSIGLSLVWNERKKRGEHPLPDGDPSTLEAGPVPDVDRLPDLRTALAKAQLVLEDLRRKGRSLRDARAFVRGLLQAMDHGGSIKPGDVAERLGWRPARAYAAWRRVKTVLRAHHGRQDS